MRGQMNQTIKQVSYSISTMKLWLFEIHLKIHFTQIKYLDPLLLTHISSWLKYLFWASPVTWCTTVPMMLCATYPDGSLTLTTYSKTRVRVSLVWMMSWSSTMLECFRPFRRDARKTQDTVLLSWWSNYMLNYHQYYNLFTIW